MIYVILFEIIFTAYGHYFYKPIETAKPLYGQTSSLP